MCIITIIYYIYEYNILGCDNMKYKNIEKAIKLKPEFIMYINIINERNEKERELDLKSINFLLETHTIDMVYKFLPRYLEL